MQSPIKNLVFEGGGMKGIAYVGAMQLLEKRELIGKIQRVGGTSAGAIYATLVALGCTTEEIHEILWSMDFRKFMDDDTGVLRDTKRLIQKFGWHKGDYFHEWMESLIAKKTGKASTTFSDLQQKSGKELYICGTNLSTSLGEVFSAEHTPDMSVALAVRISMSIPLFFQAVRMGERNDVYVDGGVLNNYPIRLFDQSRYCLDSRREDIRDPSSSEGQQNLFNQETLGFRLDSQEQIRVLRDGKNPTGTEIDDLFHYSAALIRTLLDVQTDRHQHSEDWRRTVYIDSKGVKSTDFSISDEQKRTLVDSGREGLRQFFTRGNQTARNRNTTDPLHV